VGFLNRLINIDESWIHIYDPEIAEQSKVLIYRRSLHPEEMKTQESSSKMLASVFWGKRWNFACRLSEKVATIRAKYCYTSRQTEAAIGLQTLRQASEKNLGRSSL
jgi:hypothetical protein